LWQQTVPGIAESALGGDQQHAVSGNGERGSLFDRGLGSELRLSDAQQRLLVAKVHLYIPALEVSISQRWK